VSSTNLQSLDVSNFRSIRGRIHAPLDAKVVLIHGDNGAGKTSLLSAIELALTGKVQSLERADPEYQKQLLHRSTTEGSILLRTSTEATGHSYKVLLNATGAPSITAVNEQHASFFRERVFLPQSLLGQLLQIYQDSGSDAASPLARFVAELLGLDRLDALEAGLKPLADVRNVRKNIEGWAIAENEKLRLDRQMSDQRRIRDMLSEQIQAEVSELAKLAGALTLSIDIQEQTLDEVAAVLSENTDSEAFAKLTDQQRRLASIRREIDAAQSATAAHAVLAPASMDEASGSFLRWELEYGERISTLRTRIEDLLPDVSLPSDPGQFSETALTRLRAEQKQLFARVSEARADMERYAVAQDEHAVALRQRATLDEEVGRLSNTAGSFGSALAELTSFIADEFCPVCDRNFSEISTVPLNEHVHGKVRTLSASAERLLTLGRTHSEVQVVIERLTREIESLAARRIEEEMLAALDRLLAAVETLIDELDTMIEPVREGARLRGAEVAARRAMIAAQSRNVSLAAAHDTLADFALSIGAPPLQEGESFHAAAVRLDALLADQATRLEKRLSMRRKGAEHIATIRSAITRRTEVNRRIAEDFASSQRTDRALQNAQILRDAGNTIRVAVDKVRSAIIRREFNDRLNRVWRDLFVRLAPSEPFVPAFRIPSSATQKLQPRLITEFRDDGEPGGTPGAMLSAGNLNTAALTLFIALHLSAHKELPWLILDDPVQSMDDVHIAHFAALLRTLSKEHGRQILIAVHDRQLFEYLKLELSPAFFEDSLLTLELSRGARRDNVCISRRFSFKQETALVVAA